MARRTVMGPWPMLAAMGMQGGCTAPGDAAVAAPEARRLCVEGTVLDGLRAVPDDEVSLGTNVTWTEGNGSFLLCRAVVGEGVALLGIRKEGYGKHRSYGEGRDQRRESQLRQPEGFA